MGAKETFSNVSFRSTQSEELLKSDLYIYPSIQPFLLLLHQVLRSEAFHSWRENVSPAYPPLHYYSTSCNFDMFCHFQGKEWLSQCIGAAQPHACTAHQPCGFTAWGQPFIKSEAGKTLLLISTNTLFYKCADRFNAGGINRINC